MDEDRASVAGPTCACGMCAVGMSMVVSVLAVLVLPERFVLPCGSAVHNMVSNSDCEDFRAPLRARLCSSRVGDEPDGSRIRIGFTKACGGSGLPVVAVKERSSVAQTGRPWQVCKSEQTSRRSLP